MQLDMCSGQLVKVHDCCGLATYSPGQAMLQQAVVTPLVALLRQDERFAHRTDRIQAPRLLWAGLTLRQHHCGAIFGQLLIVSCRLAQQGREHA